MPTDPVGVCLSLPPVLESAVPGPVTDELDSAQYDRSSMPPDPTIMIADQTEVDYLRRSPVRRFCEFIDGIV